MIAQQKKGLTMVALSIKQTAQLTYLAYKIDEKVNVNIIMRAKAASEILLAAAHLDTGNPVADSTTVDAAITVLGKIANIDPLSIEPKIVMQGSPSDPYFMGKAVTSAIFQDHKEQTISYAYIPNVKNIREGVELPLVKAMQNNNTSTQLFKAQDIPHVLQIVKPVARPTADTLRGMLFGAQDKGNDKWDIWPPAQHEPNKTSGVNESDPWSALNSSDWDKLFDKSRK